jgi:GWxTD domain-containing protein
MFNNPTSPKLSMIFPERPAFYTLYISLLFLLLSGCASSGPNNVNRGVDYQYRPGFPEVRFSAIGIVDPETDETYLKFSADVIYKSLVFKKVEDSLQSRILIEYSILSQTDKDYIVSTKPKIVTIKPKKQNVGSSTEMFSFEEDISVKPGSYKLLLLVTDQFSQKQTVSETFATIPDPADPQPHLTSIRVMGKSEKVEEGQNFYTLNTYDISNELDSLKFVFQVTNNKSDDPLIIRSRLMRFASDTSVARDMFLNDYVEGSLPFRGINYNDREIIQSTRRVINQAGSVLIEFQYGNLPRGNYRFEVESESAGDEAEALDLYQARDFGIRSANYPAVNSVYELAAPLQYLMTDKEFDELMSSSDPDTMKMKMDRFWLKNVKDPKIARNVIALYYERVEEANKLFASFKEGWKTDLGMIYILFGPPWIADQSLTNLVWAYSYNRADPETNFFFRAPRLRNKDYPFDNFLLQRSNFYFSIHNRQLQMWLTGGILRDNL